MGRRELVERLLHRRALRRWDQAVARAASTGPARLGRDRDRALELRQRLDEVVRVAEDRLAPPRPESASFDRPPGADWDWRPGPWRHALPVPGGAAADARTPLGEDTALFHDCRLPEIVMRQSRSTAPDDSAPYGLRLDVFRFDGSFLSLVVDLPEAAGAGLRKRHLIRLALRMESEAPLGVFARLNVRHGPNTEQMVRELPQGGAGGVVEFDLAYTGLNEKRVDKLWLDLIFENPEMNGLRLRDLTLARYPRAAL